MSLRLQWSNDNTAATTVRIYRSDTIFTKASLPAVLGTAAAGVNEYLDATAKYGSSYWYMLETVSSTDSVFTVCQLIEVSDKRGAGSSLLKMGDDNYGFFATLTGSEFFSAAQVLAAAKTTGFTQAIAQPTWYKYSREGKTLFVPDRSFGRYTYAQIYAAGFVYGVDGPGNTIMAQQTNQKTVLTLNGDSYLIRCMKGLHPSVVWDGNTIDPETQDAWLPNEYDDLLVPTMTRTPRWQRMRNVANNPTTQYFPNGSSSDALVGVLTQEINPGKTLPMRRGRGISAGLHSRNDVSVVNTVSTASSTAINFIPVLELIEQNVVISS